MGPNSKLIRYAITIWFIVFQKTCSTTFSLPINILRINTHIDPSSLEDYLYKYSSKTISKSEQTGVLLNVPLPANLSGIKVSIVRLRSSTLWRKGANFSRIDIPPKVIKMHHVKRYAIMYENLGNQSSHYYNLPGYTILSSIVGFAVYNATDLSRTANSQRLNVTISGEPIKVRFLDHQIKLPQGKNVTSMKCVRFDPINGLIVLSKMFRPNVCITRSLGLFALAIPGVSVPKSSPPPPHQPPKHQKIIEFALWKRLLIGLIAGIIGFMLIVSGFVICYKAFGLKKIARMETKAEKSESLQTRWIGTSKMPSASVTRTPAMLENDLAP